MPKICTIRHITILMEGAFRLFLVWLFLDLETREPFVRKIHPEEIWLYKNPSTDSYIPAKYLWRMVVLVPTVAILLNYLIARDRGDLMAALSVTTLALPLNGVITDVIKLSVGRHRPDFVFRCWPDGVIKPDVFSTSTLPCTGDPAVISEGRKSFPSGHSSFSFASWGFVFLYLSGKMGTFQCRTRPASSVKLLISVATLLAPLVVAVSRTADYHHHWQDVMVGSLLGLGIVWMVYRQYYPPLSSAFSDQPLGQEARPDTKQSKHSSMSRSASSANLIEEV